MYQRKLVAFCVFVCLAAASGSLPVRADPATTCNEVTLVKDAPLNTVMLGYRYYRRNAASQDRGAKLASLIQLHMLYSQIKFADVAFSYLPSSSLEVGSEDDACQPESVANRLSQQLAPGHILMVVWGSIFEEKDSILIQNFVEMRRASQHSDLSFAWRHDAGQYQINASLPFSRAAFPSQEISFSRIDELLPIYKKSLLLNVTPDAGSQTKPLIGDPAAPLALFVADVANNWVLLQSPKHQSVGWLNRESVPAGLLASNLPELDFIEGATGYLLIQAAQELAIPVQPSTAKAAESALGRFDAATDDELGAPALALAKSMQGIMKLMQSDTRQPGQVRPIFADVVRLAPYSSKARNLLALSDLLDCCSKASSEAPPQKIIDQFADAARVEPANDQGLGNLENIYLALAPNNPKFAERAEQVRRLRDMLDGKDNELVAKNDFDQPFEISSANWTMPTGDYANQRYSSLKQVTSENVHRLTPVWTFSTGILRGHEGSPLVVGDVMYVHTPFPNIVYALDLNNDGKIIWKFEPKQDPNVVPIMCCDTVNRGLSYANGRIFLHQADTTLVALNAKTGAVVWSVKNGDPTRGESGTSAPMVFKDKVIVGESGGEFGVRGNISAYSANDGQLLWRGYSVGPDSDTLIDPAKTTQLGKLVGENSSLKSWEGDQWKTSGGTAWGWYSYDPQLNLVYYGSGNPSAWNPKQRPGDNRWTTTIWARDLDTGVVKWLYQMTPHDEWDYDGNNEMVLADQTIGGARRKTLVHFDRNGFAYTLDRTNGELLVAEKFDSSVNWATKIDMDKSSPTYGRPERVTKYSPEANGEDVNVKGVCPASLGAKNEQPSSFSPRTGLFYVPTGHVCMDYEPFRVSYTPGQPYVGATLSMFPASANDIMGNFIAWDSVQGKIVWSNPEQFTLWSGALATAGDVVFYGTLEGYLKAVDAKTGKLLYKYKTPSGVIGNVMTYEHKGKQYLAVLSGVGGWAGIGLAAGLADPHAGLGAVGGYTGLRNYTALGGTLTVFALFDQ